jgi:hypothetical protein
MILFGIVKTQTLAENNFENTLIIATMTLIISFGLIASNDATASKSPYQSGYDHGASDARDDCSDGCDWYILEPGKGFEFHTQEFIDGYIDGFCDNSPPGRGSDADEATFNCP